jgi:SagB-type dehydrogenase family enzyme
MKELVCTVLGMMIPTLVLIPMVSGSTGADVKSDEMIKLPEPRSSSPVSIEEALARRRSQREYADEPLRLLEIAQLLWAAQGMTDRQGFRTAPSAGALYPLEVYAVAGKVEGLAAGVYKYQPQHHRMVMVAVGDRRVDLAAAALGQSYIRNSPASIVFSAAYERVTRKYRDRGIRYAHMEAGHAAQNVCLQAVSLDIGTVVIGAFHEEKVQKALGLPKYEEPLYILPIGKRS